MDKETGLVILTDVIKDNKRHQDYEHITELADKYYKMKTGDDITDLLEKIVTRETKEEFEPVSYTHLRAHETRHDLVCRLLLEKKKKKKNKKKRNQYKI